MTKEVDPFEPLTEGDQRRKLGHVANAPDALPQGQYARSRAKSARTLEERVLIVGMAVVGTVIVLGVAVRLSAPLFSDNPSSGPTGGPARVAASQPRPAQTAPAKVASTDPAVRADGGLDFLGLKAEAEEKLRGVLTDDSGVRYRDVQTKLSTMDGGGVVAFCGEENSHTPEGGYGGFQRFIASRSVAVTESQMAPDDFDQAWHRFCDSGVVGPEVWF